MIESLLTDVSSLTTLGPNKPVGILINNGFIKFYSVSNTRKLEGILGYFNAPRFLIGIISPNDLVKIIDTVTLADQYPKNSLIIDLDMNNLKFSLYRKVEGESPVFLNEVKLVTFRNKIILYVWRKLNPYVNNLLTRINNDI